MSWIVANAARYEQGWEKQWPERERIGKSDESGREIQQQDVANSKRVRQQASGDTEINQSAVNDAPPSIP